MADCNETLRELEAFLDDELPRDTHESVHTHLEGCMDCLQAFDFHAELRAVVREKCRNDGGSDIGHEASLHRLAGRHANRVQGADALPGGAASARGDASRGRLVPVLLTEEADAAARGLGAGGEAPVAHGGVRHPRDVAAGLHGAATGQRQGAKQQDDGATAHVESPRVA